MDSSPTPTTPDPGKPDGPGYEVRDTNIRAIIVFFVAVMLFTAVSQVGLWGFLAALTRGQPVPVDTKITAPEVIVSQLHRLRAEEAEALTRFSIDRAIDRIVEHGLPPAKAKGARSEIDVNSHGGQPVPAEQPGSKEKAGDPGASKSADKPGGGFQ